MLQAIVYLPFLPIVIVKRCVCGKKTTTDAEPDLFVPSNDEQSQNITSFPSSSNNRDVTVPDTHLDDSTSALDDLPQSRFQSIRGIETKVARNSSSSSSSSSELRHRRRGSGGSGSGGSDNNDDYTSLDRYRTLSNEYLEEDEDDEEAEGGDTYNNNELSVPSTQQRSHSPMSAASSSGFSREHVESINRAQHFINKDNGVDRQTMERLLLADRTHAWYVSSVTCDKSFVLLFFVVALLCCF